jgi:CheY-like chemotaxis protein
MREMNWENKTILIVDDTQMNYLVLKTQLRKTKANIVWLQNGNEAVQYVKNGKVADVILMDIRMPVMDGIEASRTIKEINPAVPVIIQTASLMGSAYEDISNSKCDDTIFKPIDANILFSLIDKQFEKYTQ